MTHVSVQTIVGLQRVVEEELTDIELLHLVCPTIKRSWIASKAFSTGTTPVIFKLLTDSVAGMFRLATLTQPGWSIGST